MEGVQEREEGAEAERKEAKVDAVLGTWEKWARDWEGVRKRSRISRIVWGSGSQGL